MRLIHTTTLQFTEFLGGEDFPPYAILSHTWEQDEVIYPEMKCPTNETKKKAGFIKIQKCADLAKSMNFSYIWVDTCCIDKSSSTELSEAINSMYRWYQQSKVCIAYLSDLICDVKKRDEIESCFKSCRWFTRGWTLQELIAPTEVWFYGRNFDYVGNKKDFLWMLSGITGIPSEVLNSSNPSTASVAERMSWASKRETTRMEDMAYCLMGIFDINMPLLYGEGEKAFVRLQEEIMKSSDDHSIFAWRARVDSRFTYRGLLARSPKEFQHSELEKVVSAPEPYDDAPYSVTNKGICMTVPLAPWREVKSLCFSPELLSSRFSSSKRIAESDNQTRCFEDDNFYIAILNCAHFRTTFFMNGTPSLGIILVRVSGENQYARADADLLVSSLDPKKFGLKTIYVRQNIKLARDYHSSRSSAFSISHNVPRYPFSCNISAETLDMPLEFDKDVSKNVFNLRSLNGPDGVSKVLLLHLKATHSEFFNSPVASVILKWNSQSGAYGFHGLFSYDGSTFNDLPVDSNYNQDEQAKLGTLQLPMEGPVRFRVFISMNTVLVGDRLDIAVRVEVDVVFAATG